MARTQAGLRKTIAFATLATLSMAAGVSTTFSGIAQASASQSITLTASPHTYHGHALQLKRSPGATTSPAAGMRAFAGIAGTTTALPAAVNLSKYDEKVADQGPLSSCAAWAIGYGMMGWFARSQGHAGAPFAPMYVYSQVDGGKDGGTSPASVFNVLRTQGIDTAADYAKHHSSPTTDWKNQPTAAEKTNAATNKITGWITLYNTLGAPGQTAVTALKQTLASGRPVALAIAVYSRFMDAAGPSSVVSSAGNLGQLLGYHEVLAVGYNSTGVQVQNSWGTYWGNNGYATLDWGYVAQHSFEAETIAGLSTTTNAARPVVAAVSPATGADTGGQIVTITGSRLQSPIISVSANSVTPLTVSADGTRLTFRMPSGTAGTSAMRVSTPLGVSVGGPLTYRYSRTKT